MRVVCDGDNLCVFRVSAALIGLHFGDAEVAENESSGRQAFPAGEAGA
jgi:hypothetical protein